MVQSDVDGNRYVCSHVHRWNSFTSITRRIVQFGRTLALGARGRKFKSCCADQKEKNMKLYNEDCIVQMQKMIDDGVQVDSVVTDPPYELGFMGKSWDSTGIEIGRAHV